MTTSASLDGTSEDDDGHEHQDITRASEAVRQAMVEGKGFVDRNRTWPKRVGRIP
jgi:hypothetical protein